MTAPHGPLHGVKVVTCSTAQAGTVPYMLMADLGADVIKIEVPEGGDNSRGSTVMPGFPSTYFETNNRGVKSVTLNLKTQEGREMVRAFAKYLLRMTVLNDPATAQTDKELADQYFRKLKQETGGKKFTGSLQSHW